MVCYGTSTSERPAIGVPVGHLPSGRLRCNVVHPSERECMKRIMAGLIGLSVLGLASVKSVAAMTVAEEYGWYYDPGTSSSGGTGDYSSDPACGTGTRVVCETITTKKCAQWITTTVGGGVTVGTSNGGTISAGSTCGTWIETTRTKYYP
jgi:hypothetical protein